MAPPTVVLAPSTKQILRLGLALGRSEGGRLARLAVRLDRLDRVVDDEAAVADEWAGGGGAADELEGGAGSMEGALNTLDDCSGLAIFCSKENVSVKV